ncbi:1-acylglycerol-3-phosphate O [Calocera viscosa TUFC12733]|uniref:1-acyl-sn-glycerol-3-phosphate acyltransferase n=1 Tax=Calocera viscosa (strain TUFC12733) TaxID=1330018 RepID=A0A167NT84_CALVF|nr:1-acylglycerol-3-phosphate O [Calocera viscosa TUFC12733]
MLLSWILPLVPLPFFLRRIPGLAPYVNAFIYVSSLGVLSVWGLILSIIMSPIGQGPNINYFTARSFYYFTSPLLGIRFKVEGEEYLRNTHPAVLVGNHQSMLDILYLGRIFPMRSVILAKKSLKWMPLLGQYMSLSYALFIDRKDPATSIASMSAAGKEMKKRDIDLWIFPEGTRTLKEENTLRQFKRGAFHVAVEAGIPIIPVVCENYWRLYHKGVFKGGDLKIKVLPPIDTSSMTMADVQALTTRTQEAMTAVLREISHSPTNAAPLSPTLEPEKDASLRGSVLKEVKEIAQPAPEPVPETQPVPVVSETQPEPVVSAPASTTGSTTPSMLESWTADEEEENGAVLVGRPRP